MGLVQSRKKEELKIRYSSEFRFKHSSNQMSINKVIEMINMQNLLLFVKSLPRRVAMKILFSVGYFVGALPIVIRWSLL